MVVMIVKELELEKEKHLDSVIYKLDKNEFLRFRKAVEPCIVSFAIPVSRAGRGGGVIVTEPPLERQS